jgi:hypothetical protein
MHVIHTLHTYTPKVFIALNIESSVPATSKAECLQHQKQRACNIESSMPASHWISSR